MIKLISFQNLYINFLKIKTNQQMKIFAEANQLVH
jgi:hypothetical protein